MPRELTHLSLFSGIGGLDLAAEMAGFVTVGQVEWADYPTRVLEKHWSDVERWRDVRDFTAESFRERTGVHRPTVVSAGFPCQPHSTTGKRKSSADERDMWPELRRVIGEIRPKWVLAENVRGLLSSDDGRFFRDLLRDLASLGYDAGWCTYPAAWVGAYHRRERVFVVAHPRVERMEGCRPEQVLGQPDISPRQIGQPFQDAEQRFHTHQSRLCRSLHGLPAGVDRVKALGNAVVPAQAYPIFAAIAAIEREING